MKEGLLRGWVGGWLCGGGECCLCVCGRRGAAVADTISFSRRTELSVIPRTAATHQDKLFDIARGRNTRERCQEMLSQYWQRRRRSASEAALR